jgi:predicted DNA-binding transcriptional regulator AlpA
VTDGPEAAVGRLRSGSETQAQGPGPPQDLPRMLDHEQVAQLLGLSRAELKRQAEDQGFPHPVAYYRGRRLWQAAAVRAWLRRSADR